MSYETPRLMACEAYRRWMADPANEMNCEECPERRENPGHDVLPCGQQNCWVYMTNRKDG